MPGFDGSHLVSQLPFSGFTGAVDLGPMVALSPGGNVIFVRSTAPDDFDPPGVKARVVTTLSEALKNCRANRGDVVVCLPGHSESVTDNTMLTNLVAGTRIIGVGWGSHMPTFRWTATASQWPVSVANVLIQGLRLRLEGANGVVKAINITGADCMLRGNDIEVASGASNKSTIAIEVGSAALRTSIIGNRIRGTETHNVTDGIKVVGATTPDDLFIAHNRAIFSATAGNGLIHLTVASKRVDINNNTLYNTHTSSTASVAVDAVAADGVICDNYLGTLNDGTANAQGIVFAGTATIKCFQNFSCDEPRKSGALVPAVVAT